MLSGAALRQILWLTDAVMPQTYVWTILRLENPATDRPVPVAQRSSMVESCANMLNPPSTIRIMNTVKPPI